MASRAAGQNGANGAMPPRRRKKRATSCARPMSSRGRMSRPGPAPGKHPFLGHPPELPGRIVSRALSVSRLEIRGLGRGGGKRPAVRPVE